MKKHSIIENDGIVVNIKAQLAADNTVGGFWGGKNGKKQKINLPSEQMIKRITTELSRPYVSYNDVALTENCIISLDKTHGSNGLYTCINYRDIVWVYEYAPDTALIFVLYKALSGSDEDLPDDGETMYLVVVSKDGETIVIPDYKSYFRRGRVNRKVSKNFDKFEKILLEKCPSDVIFGKTREAKIAYLRKTGKDIPKELLNEPKKPWYSEPQDEDDLL